MIIEMWEWPRPLDEDETASLLLCFGLKVATPKLVHEIEASRGKSHVTCFCANYTSFFLTWWDGIFSDLIISVMWINSEIWRFDKIQMKMWFLLHLHLGVYHDTNFSIQLDRTGIMKVSFGASPVRCRGQNLDVMTISCALFSSRRSNLKMVLTGGGLFTGKSQLSDSCGPMMVPSVFTGSYVLLIWKDLCLVQLECSYHETHTGIFWDNSQVVTPGSQNCVRFFVNNFSLDASAEMWSGAKLVLN